MMNSFQVGNENGGFFLFVQSAENVCKNNVSAIERSNSNCYWYNSLSCCDETEANSVSSDVRKIVFLLFFFVYFQTKTTNIQTNIIRQTNKCTNIKLNLTSKSFNSNFFSDEQAQT